MNETENLIKSKLDTMRHIERVQQLILAMIDNLYSRAIAHDKSKLESPEVEGFAEAAYQLANVEYESEAYHLSRENLQDTLDHHYANNRHHPEHHKEGINDMTLMDLAEMLADWKAGAERTKNGNIRKSIEVNAERFGMSEQLKRIFENTVKEMF